MLRKNKKIFVIAAVMLVVLLMPAIRAAADDTLRDRVIILDPGHGTAGSPGYGNYNEAVTMLSLANKIKAGLEALGATVHMTRTDQNDIPTAARPAMVNKWALEEVKKARPNESAEIDRLLRIIQKIIDDPQEYAPVYMNSPFDYSYKRKIHPDMQKIFEYQDNPVIRDRFLMISLHSNATPAPINTAVNGANAFHAGNDHAFNPKGSYYGNYSNVQRNRDFAEAILDNIDKLGIRKRDVQQGSAIVMREHNVPAVLVENGFHTNAQDRAKLSDDAFLGKLAKAYIDTIIDYFAGIPIPVDVAAEEYQTLEKPERYNFEGTFRVYSRPSFSSRIISTFNPQTVIIHAKTANGWVQICTAYGRHWTYLPEYKTLEKTESYRFTRSFPAYRHPSFSSDVIAEFNPQTVIVYGKTEDGWAKICTAYGKYWVYTGKNF